MRHAHLSIVSLVYVLIAAAAPHENTTEQPLPPAPVPEAIAIDFAQPTHLAIMSPGVAWRGHAHHLLTLGRASFDIDQESRLTATIDAAVLTFDDVTYDVHAAVFDGDGRLLGTARVECDIDRVWLRTYLTTWETLALDFGVSANYDEARWAAFAISERTVLTPDDWQD